MSRQRSRDTKVEVRLRSHLHRLGLDGCCWHGCPDHATWPRNNADFWRTKIEGNRARDRQTDARLVAAGWLPVRVWEHEDPEAAAIAASRRA